MSFDKFLLAVESRDLSQADKKNYLALGNLAKLMFWSILSFKNSFGKEDTLIIILLSA